MHISPEEIVETLLMIEQQNLDIRTVTLGLSIDSCADEDIEAMAERVYEQGLLARRRTRPGRRGASQREYGIPIVNKRIAVTPVARLASACTDRRHHTGRSRARSRRRRGRRRLHRRLLGPRPEGRRAKETASSSTRFPRRWPPPSASARRSTWPRRAPASTWTRSLRMAEIIKETAEAHRRPRRRSAAASSSCSATWSRTTRSWPVPSTGAGEPDAVINVGISGPGVVRAVVNSMPADADLTEVAEAIKATAFKITRAGELIAREAARRLGVSMGIVDLSLAPTPAEGDSVAEIIEAMGVKRCGGPGTTTALALLNDAVKKGGAMGTSSIGGLSGAFIPVSEDAGHDPRGAGGRADAREARGDDGRLLGRSRHDRDSRRHARRDRSRPSSPTPVRSA